MCREEELKRKHEKRLRGNIISKKTAAVFYSADVFARFFYCPWSLAVKNHKYNSNVYAFLLIGERMNSETKQEEKKTFFCCWL